MTSHINNNKWIFANGKKPKRCISCDKVVRDNNQSGYCNICFNHGRKKK